MIMIDLQKAFNTINHQILTTNFQRREYAIFNVYNRILREENNLAYISRGVPQVIYIGTYIFCYYVNDMFISTKLKQYMSSVCR